MGDHMRDASRRCLQVGGGVECLAATDARCLRVRVANLEVRGPIVVRLC